MVKGDKPRGIRKYFAAEAGFNISWASVFAGIVTFLAVLILLSLLGSAIGFGTIQPTSGGSVFQGTKPALIIWGILTFIVSFLAAGFVAGMASRRVGMLHGFLTWAGSVIVLLLMISMLASSIFSAAGSMISGAFSVAGDAASGTGDLISAGVEEATQSISGVDTEEAETQINDILQDTDVPELQPGYIQDQLDGATSDIAAAGKDLLLNPGNSEQIVSETTQNLQERADTIANAADEEAISNAVEENTDLTGAEAEEATNNITNALQSTADNAQQAVTQASDTLNQLEQDARQAADTAANAATQASIWSFVALLVGMVISTIAGILGANFVGDRDEEVM